MMMMPKKTRTTLLKLLKMTPMSKRTKTMSLPSRQRSCLAQSPRLRQWKLTMKSTRKRPELPLELELW
jgi:hypothetical protein